MNNSTLENEIQRYLTRKFDRVVSIDKALSILSRFKDILHRETLQEDLDQKYALVFKQYQKQLRKIQQLYEKHRNNPPIPRNYPKVAGCIHWSRNLLRQVTTPMLQFKKVPKVFLPKESRKIITHHNKLARTLIEFELLWYRAWTKQCDKFKHGLQAHVIAKHPSKDKLYVNFDPKVFRLISETKHLELLGFDIPETAKTAKLLEFKLKKNVNKAKKTLSQYNQIVSRISPILKSILVQHLADLEKTVRPGIKRLSWMSLSLDSFFEQLSKRLKKFDHLVRHANDIVENRVRSNLKAISSTVLLDLPEEKFFELQEFEDHQNKRLEKCQQFIIEKNLETERAIDDLVTAVGKYSFEFTVKDNQIPEQDLRILKNHFCKMVFQALLRATRQSLDKLKERCSLAQPGYFLINAALFQVSLSLNVPNIIMAPSFSKVQGVINNVAKAILRVSKHIQNWGIDSKGNKAPRRSWFEKLSSDKEIVIVLLLLTGAIEDTKRNISTHLDKYHAFSWLWTKDPEEEYRKFISGEHRILDDFVTELEKLRSVEDSIKKLPSVERLPTFNISTDSLKERLFYECKRWKFKYSEKLHNEVKADLEKRTEMIKEYQTRLGREVNDFPSLKFVMDTLAEIRETESWIEIDFFSIGKRYEILEKYDSLPAETMTKEEMDARSMLRSSWSEVKVRAENVMETVSQLQKPFQQKLVKAVDEFQQGVEEFHTSYKEHGPLEKGITPQEAMTRLSKFNREFETIQRKYELYNSGEKLFGMEEKKYKVIEDTKAELGLLDTLFIHFQDVLSTFDEYKELSWIDVPPQIEEMTMTTEAFSGKCKKMKKEIKKWSAFVELNTMVSDFLEILGLLTELSKPSVKHRHWAQIEELTGKSFGLENFNELKLKAVIEANLLEFKEDVEEITDGADKELGIEDKLNEIDKIWSKEIFEFANFKTRGEVIFAGTAVNEIIEKLEDSQANLAQMLTMRHVKPFEEKASKWLKLLSDTSDTLEKHIKIQMLWMSLEAVFTSGDIARQMPQDTRVFLKVDKEWVQKYITKIKEVKNVVGAMGNEYVVAILPSMMTDLEQCQKALDGYLEKKRNRFPRFYFVSNPALLLILSQGSDQQAVQSCFSKVFDSITRVKFEGTKITNFFAVNSGFEGAEDVEDIQIVDPVNAVGNIEDWLSSLEQEMMKTMKSVVKHCSESCVNLPLEEFVQQSCAQAALLGIQFIWTNDIEEALHNLKKDKQAMLKCCQKQTGLLTTLANMTTKDIPIKLDRTKIETMVTIQVHQRDVLDELFALVKTKKLHDSNDFNWQKQLRCYWDEEQDDCLVSVADVTFPYSYEYLGCKERLVVTPLTDRAYITLTQALGMFFGGAPAGPAGTGKTETVKDLGRALGKYVVVFNCSDQMRYTDTAKIYKGLCQSGSWGCFDEFNRIDLEVLSVVAQQVMSILNALRARMKIFHFPGDTQDVELDPRCGFFITMNPGYAGRQELPENLKALFRGVAMMVPDREIIIKVKLASAGYLTFQQLAVKFFTLYGLSEEQLSKQRHYDFGLRNILSVLRTAGVNLRNELAEGSSRSRNSLEEMILMRTLRDMNLSKLVAEDVALFIALLRDLFPNQSDPAKASYAEVEKGLDKAIKENKLIPHPPWLLKCIQLYETSLVRHGLMMIGPAGSGKTLATEALLQALSMVKKKHVIVKMNPKAIRAEEMFGENDQLSGEWTDGVFSAIWSKYNDTSKNQITWIICDGPVDAVWIENLNTVLDDNKLLTLANGDRIPMTNNVKILFEAEDLRNASPATVSRAGIIYVSSTDLGPGPILKSWMQQISESEAKQMEKLFQKYLFDQENDIFSFLRELSKVMPIGQLHYVQNLLALLDGILGKQREKGEIEISFEEYERMFLYCLCWSFGGLLERQEQLKFFSFISKIANGKNLPEFGKDITVYECFVNEETREWEAWKGPKWEYPKHFKFTECLIPTRDSIRAEYLLRIISERGKPVMVLGSAGTGKTSTVLQFFQEKDPTKVILKKVNFSSATSARMFQDSIEADIEKKTGKTYSPPLGKAMIAFLDDISMPEINIWGDQPTLEIVRQLIEQSGIYFLEKDKRGDFKRIENLTYVAAMSHPGGGRNDIPNRLKRHFACFNMTPPSETAVDNIYGQMLRGKFAENEEILKLIPGVTQITIRMWKEMKAKMLPTPSKFHYIFNLRDLSRVFQGVLFPEADVFASSDIFLQIWLHESKRVFHDKLVEYADQDWFIQAQETAFKDAFGKETGEKFLTQEAPFFVDFLRDDIIDPETDEIAEFAPKVYEKVENFKVLKARASEFLEKYNKEPKFKEMNLVLFDDAIKHLVRISRILSMPRGHALLVGVGGSGRQSLTRLAAYIARHEVCQIKLTRTYKTADLLEDIRNICIMTGREGKKVTFIFTDSHILDENFLEYINAMLATGEIAGLFPKDEMDMMCSELRPIAKKEIPDFVDSRENLKKFFTDRVRDFLHIVLCFSPANTKFSERARKFPGLISGTTIDWFLKWPSKALVSVSEHFIRRPDANFHLICDEDSTQNLINHIGQVHDIVVKACDDYFQKFRRHVYVTPKSYLSFISSYKQLYMLKLNSIDKKAQSVKLGLKKLDDAAEDVEKMQVVLAKQKVELIQAEKSTAEMLSKLEIGAKEAQVQKNKAAEIEKKCVAKAKFIEKEREIANEELQAALPFMEQASEAAKSINKGDIGIIAKLPKPPDLIKRIMDCVSLLLLNGLDPVKLATISVKKQETQFISDSYKNFALPMMSSSSFIPSLLNFSENLKDEINEETMELLEPYLQVEDFTPEFAKKVSGAAEGLCKFVRAMYSYHKASLIVAPKLKMLQEKESELGEANRELDKAQTASRTAQEALDRMQSDFSHTMKEKARIEETAKATSDKMTAASNLIQSLEGERIRWTNDAKAFEDTKQRLAGDCALACAFVSYLGPFNYIFRAKLVNEEFTKDLNSRGVPSTNNLHVAKFLVDDSTVAEWNSQGLPKDDLSIQNGILVTQASRWPLLIDPQGQAVTWLKKREAKNFPVWGTTTITHKKLRDQLEFTMAEGNPLLIEGVEEEIDPMLDPILEKNIIKKGRSMYIIVGDKPFEFNPKFRMYFITKLSNPHFSPELSAKTTVIDFAVTQKGLEDQLLGCVINVEQKALEEQRQKLVEEVNMNTIALLELDKLLLERLSAGEGNLLEDVALIAVLSDTKTKAKEVSEKIENSKQTEIMINKKREQYRPVATRGSILYFTIVDMSLVNWMYQTSLAQFMKWFDHSILSSEKANLASKRVQNIIDYLTFCVYKNVNRGLFGHDKLTFKLMTSLKISITAKELEPDTVNLFLKCGAMLSKSKMSKNPCTDWLSQAAWNNLLAICTNVDEFSEIPAVFKANEKGFKLWYEHGAPETLPIPVIENKISESKTGAFLRFLFVRAMRDDRTILAADSYIESVLGPEFVKPLTTTMEQIHEVSDTATPVILMLTPGADPTSTLEALAKKNSVEIFSVSMGEGQEPHAKKAVVDGMTQGGWTLLQNCHLGLGFMNGLPEMLDKLSEEIEVHPNFRIWITCESHPEFPITLLQMSVKVTQEAPQGMKSGLLRSYTTLINRDRIERVDKKAWRNLVFVFSFLHSIVQERRKFGPIGWCIPYEFNRSDLEASLTFLEKHMFGHDISWKTVNYMICEAQYGGKITDDFDRRLFNTYGESWLSDKCLEDEFTFCQIDGYSYKIPQETTVEKYREGIQTYPAHDSPSIFGLHTNADLTFGTKTAMAVITTIMETRPKESSSGSGLTREETVSNICKELLQMMPEGYVEDLVRERVRKRPRAEIEQVLGKSSGKVDGFSIPLNVFLFQEIVRLQMTIKLVRWTLTQLIQAIAGIVIMTPKLQNALDAIYNGKPPDFWHHDASGAKTAWVLPSLNLWMQGLVDREKQLTTWLKSGRPVVFWITGFFNPQGFLTAMRQEVTRRHKQDKWALDDVVFSSTVMDYSEVRKAKRPSEGVLITGLFLEGCSWDDKAGLVESKPRELFCQIPILHVTAIPKKQSLDARKSQKNKSYSCPVYVMPRRTDLNYVFSVDLPSKQSANHWTLRGVALLCSKE